MKPQVQELTRQIKRRHEKIQRLIVAMGDAASLAVEEAIFLGEDLVAFKELCKHGQWLIRLAEFCPGFSEQWARRLMHLATKAEDPELRKKMLTAQSIRAALLLCEPEDTQAKAAAKRWPDFQEGMGKAWKFIEFTVRHPIENWPRQTIEQLREDFAPIAAKLWPDKFATPPLRSLLKPKSHRTSYQTPGKRT